MEVTPGIHHSRDRQARLPAAYVAAQTACQSSSRPTAAYLPTLGDLTRTN